ncbi:Nif3-like dinuclear metal center hexameric protein [bacterium]|nr:Nif3-like dinuclear metal center hexameric protein [bacterium]
MYAWAPATLAWERDNIGLLVGSAEAAVTSVLVCLDITPAVVEEAKRRGANLIVAHHPVIFHPLKSLRTDGYPGSMYASLLRADINVIAMHTNADAAHDGLNTALAGKFRLNNTARLDGVREESRLARIIGMAGADRDSALRAALGDLEGFEVLPSVRNDELNIILPTWRIPALRAAVRETGGESTRILLSKLEEALPHHGIGVVGELEEEMDTDAFLQRVKQVLGCTQLRCSPFDGTRRIRRVAVSSGAGSSYVRAAVSAGADALVTGDLTHHTFLDYQHDILLVDAGHHETEKLFIDLCAEELERGSFQDKQKIDILRTQTETNPIRFV